MNTPSLPVPAAPVLAAPVAPISAAPAAPVPAPPVAPPSSSRVAPAPAAPVELAAAIKSAGPARSTKIWWLIGGGVVLGVAGWWWWRRVQAEKNRRPPYATEVLARGDISLVITATGSLVPTNQVIVGSELSGTTLEVYAEINDRVTKGQSLAKLDTSKLNQQTASSRAAVISAQAKVAQADATVQESAAALGRVQELSRLSGGKMPARSDLGAAVATAERARADAASARAAVGEAEAQVHINENDLAKALIKSPIDGLVLTRSIEPGQTVAASFTAPQLFVIAEKLERMKLNVAIAEADIGRVAAAQPATFTVDAWPDRSYLADVSRVSFGSAVTDNVVTYLAELAVVNDDLSLRPGMTATVDLWVAESKDVFRVPSAALRFSPPSPVDAAKAAVKKSFAQSLIPMPTRGSKRPAATLDDTKPAGSGAHIWILRDEQPVELAVKQGLSDGTHTEISGEGLAVGLVVILRANSTTP